jgi:hypothetical protein
LESRVGSHDSATVADDDETSPFSRATLVAHLDRSWSAISVLAENRVAQQDELSDAFNRALALLAEIKNDYESSTQPDTRKLEESLTGIERLLDDAIQKELDEQEKESLRTEVEDQIKPYKRHMDKAAFAQTRDNLLRKRIRERFDVPRLSLFFLQP